MYVDSFQCSDNGFSRSWPTTCFAAPSHRTCVCVCIALQSPPQADHKNVTMANVPTLLLVYARVRLSPAYTRISCTEYRIITITIVIIMWTRYTSWHRARSEPTYTIRTGGALHRYINWKDITYWNNYCTWMLLKAQRKYTRTVHNIFKCRVLCALCSPCFASRLVYAGPYANGVVAPRFCVVWPKTKAH